MPNAKPLKTISVAESRITNFALAERQPRHSVKPPNIYSFVHDVHPLFTRPRIDNAGQDATIDSVDNLVGGSLLMRCPNCGNRSLRLSVAFSGSVCCEFADDGSFDMLEPMVQLGSRWDDAGQCECLTCHWEGAVRDAQHQSAEVTARDQVEARMTPEELRSIREKIENAECDPALRSDLERLIEHAEVLLSQLEMVERANGLESTGKNPDTMKM